MKNKFRLWLNIATICLCVCAIAIGVYAATSATLTVSGTIGFEAHGCNGTVTGTIVGHAQNDDKDAMPTTTPVSLGNAVNLGDTLSYGTERYFTDMGTADGSVTPITIELTVTNTSLFPIEGQLVLPETEFAKAIDFDVESGLIQLGPTTPADDNTDVGKIKITMMLKSTLTDYEDPVALNFTVKFNKYAQIKYDEETKYHMTMGSNVVTDTNGVQQVQPVKWIPFAESSDGSNWDPFVNTNKPDANKEYYYIAEKVLDIGTTTVYGSGSYQYIEDSGVSYNNDYTYEQYYYSNDRTATRNDEYTTLAPNNYLASNVRNLLNGNEVSKSYTETDLSQAGVKRMYKYEPGEEKVDLLKEYGITGYVFDNISARGTNELYETDANNVTYANVPEELKGEDKLWLLSESELTLLPNVESNSSDEDLVTPAFRVEVQRCGWWLRSPDAYYGYWACCVDTEGVVDFYNDDYQGGVRPAFKI